MEVLEKARSEILSSPTSLSSETSSSSSSSKANSGGAAALALVYEPLLFHHAVIQGDVNLAHDMTMMMANDGCSLTQRAVDAMTLGYGLHGPRDDVVDNINDLQAQHGIKPTSTVVTQVLARLLDEDDTIEAKRFASWIKHVYNADSTSSVVDGSMGLSPSFRQLSSAHTVSDDKLRSLFAEFGMRLSD